ncbi:hypothetical protein GCM10018773_45060 [Streptomyces candidus]|nr:hypothetical protein GCM10018773_45060 [Streptomyces candidus]
MVFPAPEPPVKVMSMRAASLSPALRRTAPTSAPYDPAASYAAPAPPFPPTVKSIPPGLGAHYGPTHDHGDHRGDRGDRSDGGRDGDGDGGGSDAWLSARNRVPRDVVPASLPAAEGPAPAIGRADLSHPAPEHAIAPPDHVS